MTARPRIEEAAHLFRPNVGRFFIHKGHESQGATQSMAGERTSECQESCYTAGIVVRAWATSHRIIVCTDKNNLMAIADAGQLTHNVVRGPPANRVRLTTYPYAR